MKLWRDEMLASLAEGGAVWDFVVIGGGATGVGIAVDAAARGYRVALVEQSDFGKGTSSRSTKLVHGGVRYLQQGNISLVMEALRERGILRHNAPHLVSDLRFVVPNYDWWEAPFYGIGLKVYDMLAGKYGFGPSRILSREATLEVLPTIRTDGLRGGVQYYDGQFDDARLLVNLVQTAAEQGAVLVNYMQATALTKNGEGFVDGVVATDLEGGGEYTLRCRAAINATGPFTDAVRRLDDPDAPAMIEPSQGVHVTLAREFLPGRSAIMVPHTEDGRVMFAIPWHGHTVVGTTDTPIDRCDLEPAPLDEEIAFILDTAGRYLSQTPTRDDVLSVFTGIRPLVKTGDGADTAALSRDHTIHISHAGLITIAGGKWTTYRRMAEDCVDHAATIAQLEERPCTTRQLNIYGCHPHAERFGDFSVYGTDAPAIEALCHERPEWGERLHAALPIRAGQVTWSARHEMARTVDDVLARRTRALYLNAPAATEMAPAVARLLAEQLGRDAAWIDRQVAAFTDIAARYRLT
jgi:glycerol-3-phosphate dehydrogenase